MTLKGVSRKGIDYAYGNGLTVDQIKAAGASFTCRYLSWLPNGKVINKAEVDNLIAAGIAVVLNWESTGTDAVQGYQAGVSDASEAQRQATALGLPHSILYFSLDWDFQPNDLGPVAAYFQGVASVIGLNRTGAYGGILAIKALFDGGLIAWGWQTYAWSNEQWDHRAQLHQVQNGVNIGPATVDIDEAVAADFGQNPAPKPPEPVYRYHEIHTNGRYSLRRAARHYHVSAADLISWTHYHYPRQPALIKYIDRGWLSRWIPKGITLILRERVA